MELLYILLVVTHVVAALVAVGAVTVTDYLHLVSLRKKALEKQLVTIYPHLSRFIFMALGGIYLTGIGMVALNPTLLSSPLFITKMVLVGIVTINGIILQTRVAPHLDLCVLKGTKYCSRSVLYSSAISGSISIVTWYAILILALTKYISYSVLTFSVVYLLVLGVSMLTAVYVEKRARKWRA